MRTRIPWRTKLESDPSKIVPVPERWRRQYGTGRMLIARPLDVDALIRTVRKGRVVTATVIRERLARDYGVDVTCPLTTGIFIRIVAEAAEEEGHAGRRRVTPYWRVVQADGSLYPKSPGGTRAQAARLRDEGIALLDRGGKKPPRVADLERVMQRL